MASGRALALALAGAVCAAAGVSAAQGYSGITIDSGSGVVSGSFSSKSTSITIGDGSTTPPPAPPPFSLSDPLFVDLAPGASLKLTTTQDILVMDLVPATIDSIRFQGRFVDVENPAGVTIDLSGLTPTICDGDECATQPLDLTRDVVLRFGTAVGNLDVRASGTVLYLTPLAPEPAGLAPAVALGAALLALSRHRWN